MSKMHSTSLLSTLWPFWNGILSHVSKNDDEKTLLLRVIWLYLLTVCSIIKIQMRLQYNFHPIVVRQTTVRCPKPKAVL